MALVNLPPELLLRVSTFLTTTELGNFRLTNKHVERTLFDSFAREFFTKKQFMLEQISLQALVDISKHPTLSLRLSEVVIGTQVFPPDPELASSFGRATYEAGYVHHEVLMASGQAMHMLADAFSRLPNLRTVGLRDYNGLGRYRDGEFATWKSWGWSFGWEHQDTYLPSGQYHRTLRIIPPEPILPVILYALGTANVVPESIHVFLRKHAKLTPRSFNILDGYMGEKIRPVLGEMKELMLAIALDSPYPSFMPSLPPDSRTATDATLARLLQCMPKLQTLRLNFDPHQSLGSHFLGWLGSPVPGTPTLSPSSPISSVALPNLTALELGMLNVPASVLLKVLTKFNLESFSMWKCVLHSASLDNEEDCLGPLLHDLAVALPQPTRLKSVLIGFPSQMYCDNGFGFGREDPICFKPVGAGDVGTYDKAELKSEVKHHAGPGTSMKNWLEMLSKRTHIRTPEEYSDISLSPETVHSDVLDPDEERDDSDEDIDEGTDEDEDE
ncbi:hypothetical protein VTO58DRAFT_102023 [Aureobasidium pullulans]|nr:hypothetical protein JADG_005369 [Aureobasidium pullulans]